MRILVVDDEPAVRAALERALCLDGYEVATAEDGQAALAVGRERPELIILDVLMPDLDGIAVCRRLRRGGDRTPVLMLTARDAVTDRVAGLDAGATTTSSSLSRSRSCSLACERCFAGRSTATHTEYSASQISRSIPQPARSRRGERDIDLTRTEFLLLELFLLNPRQVLPRSLIFERVWGSTSGRRRTRSRCTSVICDGSWRAEARTGCCRRCAEWGTRSRAMSFRARITLAAAVAVAIAVAVSRSPRTSSRATSSTVRSTTRCASAPPTRSCGRRPTGFVVRLPTGPLGVSGTSAQIVAAAEDPLGPRFGALPVTAGDRAVAAGGRTAGFRMVDLDGAPVRAYTQQLAPGYAVLVARPLVEVNETLGRLRMILVSIGIVGIAGAALLGLLVSRSALQPVRRLTEAAEDVARTADLSRRIDVTGDDELNRLASTVNAMLASLERSVGAQRNLVADASHELRTPLTSIRTNIELLARADGVSSRGRSRMVADAVDQLEELTMLVADLVELGRDGERQEEIEDVRLDVLVADSVERVRRRAPTRAFELALEPTLVRGSPGATGPCDREPPRERGRLGPRRRADRGLGRRRRPWGSGTGLASEDEDADRLSIASIAPRVRAGGQDRAWGWRSCARWPSRMAARRPSSVQRAAARGSGSPSLQKSSQRVLRFGSGGSHTPPVPLVS